MEAHWRECERMIKSSIRVEFSEIISRPLSERVGRERERDWECNIAPSSHQYFCISNCKLDFSIFTGVQLLCCILGRYFTFQGQQKPWVSEFGSERWFKMIRALLSVIQVQHGINQSDNLIQYSCKWGNLTSQYGTVQTQRKATM